MTENTTGRTSRKMGEAKGRAGAPLSTCVTRATLIRKASRQSAWQTKARALRPTATAENTTDLSSGSPCRPAKMGAYHSSR